MSMATGAPHRLSKAAVRAVTLAAQGLTTDALPTGKDAVLATVRRMHVLQIDTINVVARSPYFVIWSRLGSYEQVWLDERHAEGRLFEYWAHAACFLPIEDYPLYRARMLGRGRWRGRARTWLDAHRDMAEAILDRIRADGSVRSSDFERTDGRRGGWWNWQAEKLALECLLDVGDLMVPRRENFQRLYDLRERVLQGWDDGNVPSMEQANERFVLNAVQALGVTKPEWVADYFRLRKPEARTALASLIETHALKQALVEGWDGPAFYHPANEELVAAAAGGILPRSRTTLLSPFDPIVWGADRVRALEVFGFEYELECYLPAAKRKFGYFTLPILHNNELIGRLDAKAHRGDGVFEVKVLHFEPGIKVEDEMLAELKPMLQECAAWHKTPEVVVRRSNVAGVAECLSNGD